MATLVIPLKNDGNYNQLRYALRSITTQHPEIDNCILVGGKPTWYTGQHIAHKDYGPDYKEQNIRDKVIMATLALSLPIGNASIPFLFANDDHILFTPIRSTWNKGLLADNLATRQGNGSYTRCLRNTLEYYGNVPNVDCHCPMWMTGEGVQKTLFDWPRFGIGFKTCYAQENFVTSEYMDDCKTDKMPVSRQWFSMTDNFPLQKLFELWPKKCIFEL